MASKLSLLPKEDIQKIILANLGFNGAKKQFILDVTKAIDQLRDIDVHHMKPKFSEIYCKLVMPEHMLDRDIHEEEIKEDSDPSQVPEPENLVIIDLVIR